MKMILVRKVFAKDRTLGELYLEERGYFCDTLEPHCIDWSKEQKTPGKTAIPEGCYKVKVGWSQKAGKNVPWLQKVPHFRDIQIHTGNVPAHTRGCILVGAAEKNVLIDSRIVFNSLMNLLKFEKDIEIEVKAHPLPLPGEGGTVAQTVAAEEQGSGISHSSLHTPHSSLTTPHSSLTTPPDDGLNPILDKFL
ncbi:MAG: DUF5675 family protein [Prevotella sp.]